MNLVTVRRSKFERRPAWRSPAADERSAAKNAKLVAIAASDKREKSLTIRRACVGNQSVTFNLEREPFCKKRFPLLFWMIEHQSVCSAQGSKPSLRVVSDRGMPKRF